MPVLQMPLKELTSNKVLAELRIRVKQNGKAVPQSSLRQDNCKLRSGTFPQGMYVTEKAVKEPLQFHLPIPDDDIEEEEAEEEKPAPKGLRI